MRRLLRKNRRLRERLAEAEGRVAKTIQLLSATALQQMSEGEEEEKNVEMINAGEEPAEDVEMEGVVKEESSEKNEDGSSEEAKKEETDE